MNLFLTVITFGLLYCVETVLAQVPTHHITNNGQNERILEIQNMTQQLLDYNNYARPNVRSSIRESNLRSSPFNTPLNSFQFGRPTYGFQNGNIGTNLLGNGNLGTNLLGNRHPLNQRPTLSGGGSSEIDPEVAKQFPELVNLLNNLKELNKLKDEGKLPIGGQGGNKPRPTSNPNNGNWFPSKPIGPTDKPNNGNGFTTKPVGPTAKPNNGSNHNNQNNKLPDNKDDKNNGNAIVISNGNVYFQAQPVVPEDEMKIIPEIIYHV